jgi:hypothetical protein
VVAPVFTDEELESLRRFPEIGRDELARFFALAPSDVAFVNPGRVRPDLTSLRGRPPRRPPLAPA